MREREKERGERESCIQSPQDKTEQEPPEEGVSGGRSQPAHLRLEKGGPGRLGRDLVSPTTEAPWQSISALGSKPRSKLCAIYSQFECSPSFSCLFRPRIFPQSLLVPVPCGLGDGTQSCFPSLLSPPTHSSPHQASAGPDVSHGQHGVQAPQQGHCRACQ